MPATIMVEGTAAENPAADTIAAKTTTTTEPKETTTEPATTTTKDPNLIHGVLPTKITAHGTVTDSHGGWDFYFEFWNVGKLGGVQYAEATFKEVLPNEDGGTITITFEGYFTGGPNGDGELTGGYMGQNKTISIKLKDGKEVSMDEFSEFNCLIDNPQAFDGWID